MALLHEPGGQGPAEIRHQLAAQLRIEGWRLSAIPPRGLYRLRDQLAIDELTRVLSRRAGMIALAREVDRARQSAEPTLSVAFLDVDGLKSINDSQGHAAGDAVLRGVAHALKGQLKRRDIVFRYGGDEFVCALPGFNVEAATSVLLTTWRRLHEQGGPSFSAGFAELRCDDDAQTIVARADFCLCAGRRETMRHEWRFAS